MKLKRILWHPRTYYIYPVLIYAMFSPNFKHLTKYEKVFHISNILILSVALQQFVYFTRWIEMYQIYISGVLAFLFATFPVRNEQESKDKKIEAKSSSRYKRLQIIHQFEKFLAILIFSFGSCILKFTYTEFGPIREEHLIQMMTQFEGKQNFAEKIDIILLLLYKNLIPAATVIIYLGYRIIIKSYTKFTFFSEFPNISFSINLTSTKLLLLLMTSFFSFAYMIYQPSWYTDSTFYQDNYVFPDNIITFPEQKRNMLIIMLESVESTFASMKNGGAFEESFIPHLETLSLDLNNVHFFSQPGKLGGLTIITATAYSLGATFSMLCGAPTGKSVDPSVSYRELMFYPPMKCLGDITKKNGYINMAMFGTQFEDLNHGYVYTAHGFDRKNVYSKSETDPKCKTWVKDHTQIKIVKQHLTEISKTGKPFFYVYTTMDTHAPGFRCKYCNKSRNAMIDTNMCNDQQIYDLLNWLKEQPYYNETTILLVGDHAAMNWFIAERADSMHYKRRAILTIINSVVKPKSRVHTHLTMFDIFPTLLAASGVKIQGDKLALGVNLMSDEKTVLDKYSEQFLNDISRSQSKWYIRNVLGTKVDDSVLNLEGSLS
ncbi:hypothetical protein TVAG_197180 [Trichomonas vaginalis G3]|uniref:Sulfatase N-terminal domain-containing protein n=1 Tax=Trichomonas vaginalis (strain ATCC PRA-98 / G3) TaxID=412133 RepID=A2EPI8_TRIV3|nr:lipoteichoic acid synthase family [Trichomonas vaginalis G3]EAY05417.1 hypothetical protein TVAG_197180 [Trichomonas vaginalis G3]KAI5523856.1 lipoteichoic acid synthase family [Trichomonas vaginalis G3]|eukprot:XP_001317640.1 hypothetical protein [Trichomonas vaginalis G3]